MGIISVSFPLMTYDHSLKNLEGALRDPAPASALEKEKAYLQICEIDLAIFNLALGMSHDRKIAPEIETRPKYLRRLRRYKDELNPWQAAQANMLAAFWKEPQWGKRPTLAQEIMHQKSGPTTPFGEAMLHWWLHISEQKAY